jgi:methanesulfonate monooxygenase small subunit
MTDREKVWDLVARSCMHLDNEEFEKYLGLLDDACDYTISSFSPDLRRDMVLLRLNKADLANLLKDIHNHVHLPGKLFRQASLYSVERKQDGVLSATSYVTVTHTNLDGASAVFCVGRYRDDIVDDDADMRLLSRRFEMETRDIGPGCHYPI